MENSKKLISSMVAATEQVRMAQILKQEACIKNSLYRSSEKEIENEI